MGAVVSYISISNQAINHSKRTEKMDEYQEELLESRAFELDPLEPADDATEL
ncbi:hypothetical protein ALQ47_03143 [Pseudomonas cichorii]|nr:hypothetical protein ALQ47_03143 [Pseudomonas cichorii]GFM49566.1 hypothetical protein PSCICE_08330 [Pseudomonas cichorii]GFM54138.1 hypothetical protein PSCICF_03160 [Pseudomonas cichorii]GFM59422.1 hypothetical protein PSCICG_05820 [Pseudomonas cichorii]